MAYHAHHMPKVFLQFGVVVTYVTQLGVSIFCVSPSRRLRLFGGWCHILHQIGIFATGNYNFFNLLTILAAVSCFDDEHLAFLTRNSGRTSPEKKNSNKNCFGSLFRIFMVLLEIGQGQFYSFGDILSGVSS